MTDRGLSKASLQLIAAVVMVLDHITIFFPGTAAYFVCRFLGRMTIVIMSFFVAEGYHRTRNIKKYILRMGVFAALSQIPFWFYESALLAAPESFKSFVIWNIYNLNVIYSLFISLCTLAAVKSERLKWYFKLLAVALGVLITRHSDWYWFSVLWVLVFGLLYGNKRYQLIGGAGVVCIRFLEQFRPVASGIIKENLLYTHNALWSLTQLGGLFALPLLAMYNGKKGKAPKLGFYLFYPLHLILIGVIERVVF